MNYETLNTIGGIIFGLYFVYSGWQHFKERQSYTAYAASKKIPMPGLGVFVSGVCIFLGGLGIAFDYRMTESLILIIIFLVPVTVFMHNFWSDTDAGARANNKVAFLKNIALLGAALMLLS